MQESFCMSSIIAKLLVFSFTREEGKGWVPHDAFCQLLNFAQTYQNHKIHNMLPKGIIDRNCRSADVAKVE